MNDFCIKHDRELYQRHYRNVTENIITVDYKKNFQKELQESRKKLVNSNSQALPVTYK